MAGADEVLGDSGKGRRDEQDSRGFWGKAAGTDGILGNSGKGRWDGWNARVDRLSG